MTDIMPPPPPKRVLPDRPVGWELLLFVLVFGLIVVLAMLILAAAFASPAGAQQYYFGQNQVQFDKFQWKIIETAHFLVHYYPEERDGIMDAARMAERSYARLSRMLKHEFREKKPLIIYRSRGDFGQNNITGDLGEGVGGGGGVGGLGGAGEGDGVGREGEEGHAEEGGGGERLEERDAGLPGPARGPPS